MTINRKPHIHKVKEEILNLVETRIASMVAQNKAIEEEIGETCLDNRRTIAIWIKQRNRLAKEIGLPETPLPHKTGQGSLIWLD